MNKTQSDQNACLLPCLCRLHKLLLPHRPSLLHSNSWHADRHLLCVSKLQQAQLAFRAPFAGQASARAIHAAVRRACEQQKHLPPSRRGARHPAQSRRRRLPLALLQRWSPLLLRRHAALAQSPQPVRKMGNISTHGHQRIQWQTHRLCWNPCSVYAGYHYASALVHAGLYTRCSRQSLVARSISRAAPQFIISGVTEEPCILYTRPPHASQCKRRAPAQPCAHSAPVSDRCPRWRLPPRSYCPPGSSSTSANATSPAAHASSRARNASTAAPCACTDARCSCRKKGKWPIICCFALDISMHGRCCARKCALHASPCLPCVRRASSTAEHAMHAWRSSTELPALRHLFHSTQLCLQMRG